MQYIYIAYTNIVKVYIKSYNSRDRFASTVCFFWLFSNIKRDTLRICPIYTPYIYLKALYNILYLLNTLNSKK